MPGNFCCRVPECTVLHHPPQVLQAPGHLLHLHQPAPTQFLLKNSLFYSGDSCLRLTPIRLSFLTKRIEKTFGTGLPCIFHFKGWSIYVDLLVYCGVQRVNLFDCLTYTVKFPLLHPSYPPASVAFASASYLPEKNIL
jgi:hypothetical protein